MANAIVCTVSIQDKKKVYHYTILAASLDQAMAFVRQGHPEAIGYSGQITMTEFYDLYQRRDNSTAKTFTIEPHDGADKQFRILSHQIDLIVDYDDVDHKTVDRLARTVAKILNEHWDAKE